MNKNKNTEVCKDEIDSKAISKRIDRENLIYTVLVIVLFSLMIAGIVYATMIGISSVLESIETTNTGPVMSLSQDTDEDFIVYLSQDSKDYILAKETEYEGLQLLRYPVDKTIIYPLGEISSPSAIVNMSESKFCDSEINSVELYLPEYVIKNISDKKTENLFGKVSCD